jgi:hypothetical protein
MNEARDVTSGEADASGDDAARIEADIAQTRDEMTGTVEAIGDRLAPESIVANAKQTVRDATVGRVEDMTSTATEALTDAGTTVQATGSGLLETIKQNPVPAAFAGLGIAWLWTHRADTSASRGYPTTRSTTWDTGYGGANAWSPESDTAGIGDKMGDVADTVGRRVSDVGDAVGQLPRQVGGSADGLSRQAQRLMDESPLAVAAAAVAIGAAISMALPLTQTERRVLGPAAGQVIGSVQDTATEALQKVQEASPS